MRGYLLRLSLAVSVLTGSWGCGRTPQVAGDWSGRVAPAHFDFLELRLTQDGKAIHGTACYEVVPGSSSGGVVFRNATVSGMYPSIRVAAADYGGWTFTGEFQEDGTLEGQWRSASTSDYPMSLARGLPSGPASSGCF